MRAVYHSYEGRFSDSPRAIYTALRARDDRYEHVWLADPGHEQWFPTDVATVGYGTAEGIAVLQDADLIVANTHTDLVWRKRPGAFYLQTWHGTPLKRIHRDVLWAPEGRLDRLDDDVAQWDCLLSPSPTATSLLRGAFHYDREILETGYPRNDVLASPDAGAIRARLRDELGIPEGRTAVLYTPTWRDDVVFGVEGAEFGVGLEAEALAEQLGDDHVLLMRTHYTLTGRLAAVDHHAVRDVSFHPDVSELYLAADVLVTDYSSTMFDFAVTGKPMLFFTYDLEDYEGRQRGFYFDFAEMAPAPLLATNDELIAALRDLPAVSERYAEKYALFRERFCHLEDGHATERVVARLP